MFWKKKPSCPITIEDKEWVEGALDWIEKELFVLTNKETILPTKKYFDRDFTGIEEDAYFVLKQLFTYFDVDTSEIKLEFFENGQVEIDRGMMTQKEDDRGTLGIYPLDTEEIIIQIERSQLKDPIDLIATLSHELSHYVLLDLHDVYLEGEENEWFTDLFTIAQGFGIFLGNTKFKFSQWTSGDGWLGWKYSSAGYLPLQMIAYTMAEIACRRDEEKPEWTHLLTSDFRDFFKQSDKYIKSIKS